MAADPLQRFHPDIAKFVEAVLNNGGFGVCGEFPKIADPKTRWDKSFSLFLDKHEKVAFKHEDAL